MSHSKEGKKESNNELGQWQQQQQQWSGNSTAGSGCCSNPSIGERKQQLTGGGRSGNSSNVGETAQYTVTGTATVK